MKTAIPLFPGFYETQLSEFADDNELTKAEASRKWLNELSGLIEVDLKFIEVISPREYNFMTDTLIAEIDPADLHKMMREVSVPVLEGVLDKNFTPRSGFVPFFSNDIEDWIGMDINELDDNEAMIFIEAYIEELDLTDDVREIEYELTS